jgi:hypothetical protein
MNTFGRVKTWHYSERKYINRDTNEPSVMRRLVPPGYYLDAEYESRPAKPIPVHGPFSFRENGYGLGIVDSQGRDVFWVPYDDKDGPFTSYRTSPSMLREEALWLATTMMTALNALGEKTEPICLN